MRNIYHANGLKAGSDKVTLYPLKPTLKALGKYIAKHDDTFGKENVMFAIYKSRKFHGYYTLEGDKLVRQGTLRLTDYHAI